MRCETRNRFGFFGQINPYKGLDIVLQALHELPKVDRKKIVREVHGANLELQPTEYREKIERLRAPLIKHGIVQWVGPYQPHDLRARMAGVDWVLVPSIWWENSPMVIQEAFVHGRPVICSDIGGMAEKVLPDVNGMHVAAGSVLSWQTTLRSASQNCSIWDRLVLNITKPLSCRSCAEQHFSIYAEKL